MTTRSQKLQFFKRSTFLFSTCVLIFITQARCFSGQNMASSRHHSHKPLKVTPDRIVVAVTREDGKNGKLLQQLKEAPGLSDRLELFELPCIEHASGPDIDILASTLGSKKWDYVAVTSPEAAKVLASAWDIVRDEPIPVVAVGAATEKALQEYSIAVCFTPSKATAKTLAVELELKGPGTSLLYPASARAKDTLQKGLEQRGFEVTRLNTYDTTTAQWSAEQKEDAKQVKVACFASPSSIEGWLQNTGDNKDVVAACIGETSAKACRGHNWEKNKIFFPEKPGLKGWVQVIQEAADNIKVSQA